MLMKSIFKWFKEHLSRWIDLSINEPWYNKKKNNQEKRK